MNVRAAGRVFSSDDARYHPEKLGTALRDARQAVGHVECLCVHPPRQLQIRQVGERFFVALWPQDGPNHDPQCIFYRDESAGRGLSVATQSAIKELDDGRFDVRLDVPIKRAGAPATPIAGSVGASEGRARGPGRARTSLLGMLHHLWDLGQLNRWGTNWRRDWWRVKHQIGWAAESTVVSRRPFSDLLYVPQEFRQGLRDQIDLQWSTFRREVLTADAEGRIRSGFMLGEVRGLEPAKYGGGQRLDLKHHRDPLIISPELYGAAAKRFIRALARISNPDPSSGRVIALAQVEASNGTSLRVVALALMVCSRDYVPVDSNYEAQVAHKLVDEGRAFSKPIKLDENEDLLPDFILTDTRPPTMLEVFGMETPEYLRRKEEKLRLYRDRDQVLWTWEAVRDKRIPALPSAA